MQDNPYNTAQDANFGLYLTMLVLWLHAAEKYQYLSVSRLRDYLKKIKVWHKLLLDKNKGEAVGDNVVNREQDNKMEMNNKEQV